MSQYCSIYVAKPYLSCFKGTFLFSFKYVNIQPVANSANSKTRNPIKAPRVIVAPSNGLLCSESIAVASSTKGVCFGSIEFIVTSLREQLILTLVTVTVESTVVAIVEVCPSDFIVVRLVVVRHFVVVVVAVVITVLVYMALAQ